MAQIFTGAKGTVQINGEVFAFCSGIDVNEDNTLTDVDIMGQLEVGDLAETAHKCSFTVRHFKVVNPEIAQTASQLGLISAIMAQNKNRAYFDVVLLDDNGNEIYKCQDSKWEGGSGSVDARGVWQGNWNFKAKKGFGL